MKWVWSVLFSVTTVICAVTAVGWVFLYIHIIIMSANWEIQALDLLMLNLLTLKSKCSVEFFLNRQQYKIGISGNQFFPFASFVTFIFNRLQENVTDWSTKMLPILCNYGKTKWNIPFASELIIGKKTIFKWTVLRFSWFILCSWINYQPFDNSYAYKLCAFVIDKEAISFFFWWY